MALALEKYSWEVDSRMLENRTLDCAKDFFSGHSYVVSGYIVDLLVKILTTKEAWQAFIDRGLASMVSMVVEATREDNVIRHSLPWLDRDDVFLLWNPRLMNSLRGEQLGWL